MLDHVPADGLKSDAEAHVRARVGDRYPALRLPWAKRGACNSSLG